jgi:hypothetical protein
VPPVRTPSRAATRSGVARAALLGAAVALPACAADRAGAGAGAGGGAPACTLGFLGDPKEPPAIVVTALGPDGTSREVKNGDRVPLLFPPQGGRVIFAGVRATNVDACAASLGGALRDLATGQVRLDERTVNLKPAGGGWGGSVDAAIDTFANVPTCPNEWASTAVDDHPFELVVTLTDRGGRTVTETRTVTPSCAEPDREAECRCICRHGYVLGEACGDAGAPRGSTP